MERHCSTGQSPQWAVMPIEEEEEEEVEEEEEEEEVITSTCSRHHPLLPDVTVGLSKYSSSSSSS